MIDDAEGLDRLYLLCIVYTMARVGEINKLKWSDIHKDYLLLRTRKARNSNIKERKIPLNKPLKEVIRKIPKVSEYVFINPYTNKTYLYRSKLIKGICKRAGIKEFAYHVLRHYGASKLAESGVPLTVLGHDKVSTTDLYLQTLKPSLRKVMEKIHPFKAPMKERRIA